MKKIFLTLISVLTIFHCSYAQWTASGNNIFNNNYNTGYVGIGTTTPTNILTVSGSGTVLSVNGNGQFNNSIALYGSFDRIGNFAGTLANSGGVGFILGPATYTDTGSLSGATVASNAYAGIAIPTFASSNTSVTYTNGYNLYISGAPVAGTNVSITNPYAFYVNSGVSHFGGNVLIGENLPQVNSAYILDINGSARAKAITVNTSGADFVFEPTYKLFSLPEIEKYIKANHHLPEIPSAKEMQTNGLNVGDNEIKLLQKVEELTLYLIEKDKKEQEQEAINKRQQATIAVQDNKLQAEQEQIDLLKQQMAAILKQLKQK